MEGTIKQTYPGCADGWYRLKAKGCIAACVYWADQDGLLPGWTPIAYFPIGPNGIGMYRMTGGRAVPAEATHLLMRAVCADLSSTEEVLVPIPVAENLPGEKPAQRFLVLSDLHLNNKPWQIRRALSLGKDCDGILIPGDITNDGTPEQFARFWQCITETIPRTPVFAVAGNHDYPIFPLPQIQQGIGDYPTLQRKLLDRAANLGNVCSMDCSGAYAAVLGNTEILGLNAATHWRRLRFPESRQLEWLSSQLRNSHAKHRIILCHAPLAAHRPNRRAEDPPYLHPNQLLQQIMDSQKNVLFLSGHTHVSLNCRTGCAERDRFGNFYINAGSIHPTTLPQEEPLQPSAWAEGNAVEMRIGQTEITVTGISIPSGKRISRGYYRFKL